MLCTCNGYTGAALTTEALAQSCLNDGGQASSTHDAGYATCWGRTPEKDPGGGSDGVAPPESWRRTSPTTAYEGPGRSSIVVTKPRACDGS